MQIVPLLVLVRYSFYSCECVKCVRLLSTMLLIPLDLRFYLFYTFIYIYKFFSDYRILLIIHDFKVENTLSNESKFIYNRKTS